ncbi:MAG TPA: 4Fe-4S binding protein, partial [Methylomirabilota bacterium]|nr:4Fe-4S binding protein [Methylomirabilota bacterium]
AADAPPLARVVVAGYRVELAGALERGVPGHVVVRLADALTHEPVTGAVVTLDLDALDPAAPGRPAEEETWAGQYAAMLTPERAGPQRVRVRVLAAPGRAGAEPLVVDVGVDVHAPARAGVWVGVLLAALVGGAGIAVYGLWLRARQGLPDGARLDLLAVPGLARGLRWRGWQPALQAAVLVPTAAVVVLGLADVQDGSLSLATRLTWTLWWAGVVFTFLLIGRVWCVACPFGALNEWSSRLRGAARRLPAVLRNLWWATGAFVVLTWADEQLGVVRSPRVTAWLVLGLAAAAVAVGLVFERRSFCRYLCPIGGLIGLYSMTAPLELRARSAAVCRADPDKGCYRGTAHAAGCPMLEFPATLDRNNYCTLCLECARGCGRDNLALRLRPFGRDLWASSRRALDEAYLGIVLVGLTLLATAQMLPAWSDLAATAAAWLPAAVRQSLRPVTYLHVIESVLLLGGSLVLAPLLLLAATAVSERLAGPRRAGWRRAFVTFAYMFVPIGLALHLAHNLGHLLLEGGGVLAAAQRAALAYTPLSLGEPDWQALALASPPVVLLAQSALIVALFALALPTGYRLALRTYGEPVTAVRALLPLAILAVLFVGVGLGLLAQPMGLRHGM